jgi:light-regulated signal transduction histidine kinase (bacteriophytochrome)
VDESSSDLPIAAASANAEGLLGRKAEDILSMPLLSLFDER